LCMFGQVLSRLSHASRPFCSGHFGNGVSPFAQANLECNPPILYFPTFLRQVGVTPCPARFHPGRNL
jgi:hypothetical protein